MIFFSLFLKHSHRFYLFSLSGGKKYKSFIIFIDYKGLIRSEKSEYHLPQIQNGRIRALLRHAKKSVPFWREQKIENLKLENFPVTGKQEIKRDFKKFISTDTTPSDYLEDITSGTSGIPFSFLSDRRFLLRRSVMHKRGNSWAGFAEADKTFRVLRREIPGLEGLGTFYKFSDRDTLIKDKNNLYKILSSSDFVLYSFSSFVTSFAELVEKDNIVIPLKAVVSTGEQLSPFYKELCEKMFKCKVFDSYSMREFGRIAQECGEHNGMHINSEMFFIEIVGTNGEELEDGREGRIVITSFDNYVMPFIRYDTGDIGRIIREKCQCGRVLPRIFLSGRAGDNIQLGNGRKIHPSQLYKIFNRRFREIKQFQILQKTINDIVINIIPTERFRIGEKERIRDEMVMELGQNIRIVVNTVDKFDLTSGGKIPVFISEIKEKN